MVAIIAAMVCVTAIFIAAFSVYVHLTQEAHLHIEVMTNKHRRTMWAAGEDEEN